MQSTPQLVAHAAQEITKITRISLKIILCGNKILDVRRFLETKDVTRAASLVRLHPHAFLANVNNSAP